MQNIQPSAIMNEKCFDSIAIQIKELITDVGEIKDTYTNKRIIF